MRTTLKTRYLYQRMPSLQQHFPRHPLSSSWRLLDSTVRTAAFLPERCIGMLRRFQPVRVLATLTVALLPTAAVIAHELDNWFGLDWPPIYVQAGLEQNPEPGDHSFPADSVTIGFGPTAPFWSNWIPNAVPPAGGPAPPPTFTDLGAGNGVRFRGATFHDVALHADEITPSNTWSYDITVAEPSVTGGWGPGGWWWAGENRVRGSVIHPVGGHADHYMAVVGVLRGSAAGPTVGANRVIIGGSIGRHTYPYPGLPNKEPIFGGAGLVPPSRLPSPEGDLPGGQLLTIIDGVDDGIAPHFSLTAMLDGLQSNMISNVFVRQGQDGPILIDLRPQLQLQHLGPTGSVLTIDDAIMPPHVAQAISAGDAYVSIVFPNSVHPDGAITGLISVEASTPAGVPGDYNGDNIVDAADYTIWRKNNGAILQLPNEVAGVTPGHVTQEDYDAWRARYGNTANHPTPLTGNATALHTHAAIPEPATAVLLWAGALVAACMRRATRTETPTK